MEALDFMLATVQDISSLVVHYPLYSAVTGVFVFFGLIRFYCRLTLGVCDIEHDMSGKTVLITGASSGIGKETALNLAKRKARVLLACRNLKKAQKVAEDIKQASGNPNVVVKSLDLCSFKSIRECAKDILGTENRLDVLINNAGITGSKHKLTEDGYDLIMQSNHFGHFLLTLLLLDLLKKSAPSRIINVSSIAHVYSKLDLEDLNNESESRNIYGKTKLANVLFTRELAERLQGTGVTVNALHPGVVKTDILDRKEMGTLRYYLVNLIFELTGKTPEEGAQTTIRLAVDPALEKITGKYFSDCKEKGVSKEAKNKILATRLFDMSEQIVGETFK